MAKKPTKLTLQTYWAGLKFGRTQLEIQAQEAEGDGCALSFESAMLELTKARATIRQMEDLIERWQKENPRD